MSKLKILKTIGLYCVVCLVTASAAVNLYKDRVSILATLSPYFADIPGYEPISNSNEDNQKWAKRIMEGGYILHFRHAERDRWLGVQLYDALESDVHNNGINGTRFAENDYFSRAVCLNDRGKIQAQAIREHFKHTGFPVGYVISSPSCRARQTAELAFDGYDDLNRNLVHQGPYTENESERINKVRDLYLSLPIEPGKNTIVSAHNSVVHAEMFENDPADLILGEGGFFVISRNNGILKVEYEFHDFQIFSKVFYER